MPDTPQPGGSRVYLQDCPQSGGVRKRTEEGFPHIPAALSGGAPVLMGCRGWRADCEPSPQPGCFPLACPMIPSWSSSV